MPTATQTLTQEEFAPEDFDTAAEVARRLGYGDNTAYTSTSALWGLFCLPRNDRQHSGCIIKTREFGLMFVADAEDLQMEDTPR